MELREPIVIVNAVDTEIFHAPPSREPLGGRKTRLVASRWSDNRRKGASTLAWLDENLDWERYEMTFIGRSPVPFENIRSVGAIPSEGVAEILGEADMYIAASQDDPCSNALLEALACGLPAAYLQSGGHPELVGEGGLPFTEDDELPEVLERLGSDVDAFRSRIRVPRLSDVADRYLEVLLP
jgi:glycosyltransferase involved in cell wall biosynthesis